MSPTDRTLLMILAILMSVFFALLIALAIGLMQITASFKRIIIRAEEVADNVEQASEAFRDTTTKMSIFKMIDSIMKMGKKGKR